MISRRATGCALALVMAMVAGPAHTRRSGVGTASAERVLVVVNAASADSQAVGEHYVRRRGVPAGNVCRIECTELEVCERAAYAELIEKPVREHLRRLRNEVDFIVLTRGIPIKTRHGPRGGYSVDSLLAAMELGRHAGPLANPYFNRREPFSSRRYGLYLVTRLTGYTRAQAIRLVDRSLSARPEHGLFLFHTGPGHQQKGFRHINQAMIRADQLLRQRGLESELSPGPLFHGPRVGLMGYYSWGSNDKRFDRRSYRGLRFLPGAIAETAVSTSARTFADRNAPGQSLIGDLIAQGAAGAKGYVSEPFTTAMARADILFERYTTGFTLAESFYMASPQVRWKDLVVGDPLCAPYASGIPPGG